MGSGSVPPPRLIELSYQPGGAQRALVLIGKGITFDSGGLSLKPNDGMKLMKTDMAGGAAVIAAMSALGRLGVRAGSPAWWRRRRTCRPGRPAGDYEESTDQNWEPAAPARRGRRGCGNRTSGCDNRPTPKRGTARAEHAPVRERFHLQIKRASSRRGASVPSS